MYQLSQKTLDALKLCAVDEEGNPLVCHGCGHSLGSGEFPNGPSGERPCHFCIRNVKREEWLEDMKRDNPVLFSKYGKEWTAFYNNAPMRQVPMDCYNTVDRIMNDVPPGHTVIT